LLGWLDLPEGRSGIDDSDPLGYRVEGFRRSPSAQTLSALGLKFSYGNQATWIADREDEPSLVYEAWGDIRGDEREDWMPYSAPVRSAGWRLRASTRALAEYLAKIGADLVITIDMTRRNKSYDYPREGQEAPTSQRHAKVILLSGNGTLEDSKGRLGTWATLGS
jgi:hypothetical protein